MLVSKIKEIRNGRVIVKDAEWDNMNYAGEIHGCKVFRDDKDRYHVYRNGKSILSYQYGSWSQLERDVAKKVGANDSKTKDKHSKTRDRNLTEINQERRNLENAYAQALRDGDKASAKGYSDRLEELRKEAIKAEEKRDEERKNFGDTKDEDDIFKKRQIEIAKKTLRMPDAMVNIIGGMTKAEAREILKKYGVNEGPKDAIDPTQPKNIAAAKNLSKAQGQAASDGGPGSGKKGHSTHHLPDPTTHQERRKERANLQKYFENAMRSGNIKEAQKHSQRLAHINSLQLKG